MQHIIDLLHNWYKQLYDCYFLISMSILCFHMTGYPKNQCFSGPLQVSRQKSLMAFTTKRWKKDTASKHEAQRLTKRKERERSMGAGRPFKLDVKNRFLMLLVYYRLYITYTLAGFLFDLDQSNVCRDIQKLESLIRKCVPIPQKIYNRFTKRLRTLEG